MLFFNLNRQKSKAMPLDPNKVFMFPESYNQLRKELMLHWTDLWNDPRCGWAMAFDMPMFIEFMNSKLDSVLRVTVVIDGDEKFCDYVCSTFLKELRRRRGPDATIN